jgi:tRNA(Ile)-lysidine synthase
MPTIRFVSAVRNAVVRRRMILPGETVVVACSGGTDSVALLHALLALRETIPCGLAVAHFHHGLRRRADRDAAFVRDLAGRSGLAFYLGRRDVRAYARRHGLNLEEAGRVLRYAFLKKTAAKAGAVRIATGHTLDDQAETVLIRLFRGSGPRGLSGIAPKTEDGIIRPLLGLRRREAEAYLRENGSPFVEDETNRDPRFLRNRVRRDLIPFLEKDFEPAVAERLGALAEIMGEEDALLDGFARRKTAALVDSRGRLDPARLSRLPVALARRVVRVFIEAAKGDLRRISFDDVERVRSLKERRTAVLPGGLRIVREEDGIFPSTRRMAKRKTSGRVARKWDGRGELAMPETGARFHGRFLRVSPSSKLDFDDSRRAYLDADRLRFPVVVRGRRDGDLYRPLGSPGRKKLKEIFRAKGVPVGERALRAVFSSADEIAWVEGLPVAEGFKVSPSTRRIWRIIADGKRQRTR